MKIISADFKSFQPFIDPDKDKIIAFLKINLKNQEMSFDQLRSRMQLTISDKRLHRICIDAGYGVIK